MAGKTADATATPAPEASASSWKTDATHVSIRSPRGPRWRAGRQFGPDAVVAPKADFTDRQAAMLLGDPQLVVAEVADPAPAPASK